MASASTGRTVLLGEVRGLVGEKSYRVLVEKTGLKLETVHLLDLNMLMRHGVLELDARLVMEVVEKHNCIERGYQQSSTTNQQQTQMKQQNVPANSQNRQMNYPEYIHPGRNTRVEQNQTPSFQQQYYLQQQQNYYQQQHEAEQQKRRQKEIEEKLRKAEEEQNLYRRIQEQSRIAEQEEILKQRIQQEEKRQELEKLRIHEERLRQSEEKEQRRRRLENEERQRQVVEQERKKRLEQQKQKREQESLALTAEDKIKEQQLKVHGDKITKIGIEANSLMNKIQGTMQIRNVTRDELSAWMKQCDIMCEGLLKITLDLDTITGSNAIRALRKSEILRIQAIQSTLDNAKQHLSQVISARIYSS